MQHVVIIGNGISGITAARHIRKLSDCKITVISGETDYFFSRTALMYVYMGHLKFEHTKPYEDWFWEKNRIELKRAWVKTIDFEEKKLYFRIPNEDDKEAKIGGSISYDKLILALGSTPNKFGWKGQNLRGVQGLYSYQDLESLQEITPKINHAVIVGGGLIGVELAEMLHSKGIKVTFLVRESSFWNAIMPSEESNLIAKHIAENHIKLQFSSELEEIIGDENNQVKAIKTKSGEIIDCQFVGLTVGVSPNINFLKLPQGNMIGREKPAFILGVGGLKLNRGILVNEYLETNLPDIYAIGDCVEHENPPKDRKNLEQIWYTGRIMGETVARTICGKPTKYQPGMFFNSAKFFDIEYQTYGQVPNILSEDFKTFYWEHSSGKICVRINYEANRKAVTGVNTFGIRMRHEVWDEWISTKKTIEYVLENLPKANFDPEFFKQYEAEIMEKYNQETGSNLKLKSKKGIFSKIF
ncbi:Coenzyme A disulfide reductase [Emticicia aquatica]|uniref:Coenzyme A disulfide reductase n=1 Tax=Emticicia aquatica TaxID=1681835 RepID=A0ABM9ALU7_9BACT|nr:FAD/NAD(P)-binding oxidoreductase [Emticicia aquatica]CAH0994763.1 Coenzyme A disulfide reductase [Emticicia aquatica]